MLLEWIWALRHLTGLPSFLWGKALNHAMWLKNCTATWTLDNKTPFEALFGSPPDLSGLRQWGCTIWVHDDSSSKLDVHARKGHWLSFDHDSQAHRVYWPKPRKPSTVTIEQNVYFMSAAPLKGEQLLIPTVSGKQTCYVLRTPKFHFSLLTNTFSSHDLFPPPFHHMTLPPDCLPIM